ncbi:MAG TPA: hypothetical protein VE338_21885 [Ktedonobacterales bacterium]|jgi:hypothetical protein|nr:hypothetical protein [Ktedonobacterales bacterium]
MGWLITGLARLVLLGVWIWSPLVTRAFHGTALDGWLLPLLGVLFLPLTALSYVLLYVPGSGVTGWSWLWVVLAFLIDLGTHSSGAYSNRKRIANYRASRRGLPA